MTMFALYIEDVVRNSLVKCKYLDSSNHRLDICITEDIPSFHKVAISNILQGEDIIKYGEVIGKAKSSINIGEHVHIHNVDSKRVQGNIYRFNNL